MPDREARAEAFFFAPAACLPDRRFLLGGNGWGDKAMTPNVRCIGHAGTAQHNALNVSALAVLNGARDSMAKVGFSPATRVFEATACGTPMLSDVWAGTGDVLTPGREILTVRDTADVLAALSMAEQQRAAIGAAGRRRTLREHTGARRAAEMECWLASVADSPGG
jgi:spore maturation protein CgeB